MRHLLSAQNSPLGEDDDACVPLHLHGLRHAVGVARVVDVARQPSHQRGIHYALFVQAEHVDAAVLEFINEIREIKEQQTILTDSSNPEILTCF